MSQWLAQDPARQAAQNNQLSTFINYPMGPTWASVADHHVQQRGAGYRGLFMCGGGACYFAGGCDDLGRRL
jgi:hypothetical protein